MTTLTKDTAREVVIPQYTPAHVVGVWAAAALPMGLLAWVGAPLLAHAFNGPTASARALFLALTAGLLWQFVLVMLLVRREQGTLRWHVVRKALWLQKPVSPRTGRRGGRVWWVLVPFTLLFASEEFLPLLPHPASHDFGAFLDSHAGHTMLAGHLLWPAIIIFEMVLNTVLGEELLFRGLLLPRMAGAFGRWDWVANGVLFAAYHLHQPWSMPGALCDTFALAYPSRRYRSAWLGIIVHSTQTVFLGALMISLALS
jgi:uncharacterized protein